MMKLEEIYKKLLPLYNTPFGELAKQAGINNTGNTGQFLQALLGMTNDCRLTDFEDGQVRINKADAEGMPKETMLIAPISQEFDKYFFNKTDGHNPLFPMIDSFLYLPTVTDGNNADEWCFLPAHYIKLSENKKLFIQLQKDLTEIKDKVFDDLKSANDNRINTSNGKYLQIRSKDSKDENGEYNPVFSKKLDRHVSNKNYAFYFKKNFMTDIQKGIIKSEVIG